MTRKYVYRRRARSRAFTTAGALALGIVLVAGLPAQDAAKPPKTTKRLNVSRIADQPPKIDGQIDDPCWKSVEPVSGFFQYDPVNGAKASEETFVWAAYDPDTLYFAFLMKDSQPDKIWAELTPRNEWENNDAIELILDAYNDKRTSITFAVNPRGVQKNSVETIWKSEAVIRPDGWSAEMAIPFKSLSVLLEAARCLGGQLRAVHPPPERDGLLDRRQPRPAPAAANRGVVRPRRSPAGLQCRVLSLRRRPRVKVGRTRKTTRAPPGSTSNGASGPMFIWTSPPAPISARSNPTPSSTSSRRTKTTSRRTVPFSARAASISSSARATNFTTVEVSLFYSRRIRNPKLAAKLSGKTGGLGFGVLGALNKEDGEDDYFGVFRVQKDIFKNSQVGVYYAGVHDGVDRNQNIAFDYNFNFKDFDYLQGMSALTFNEGASNARNGIHQLGFRREPDAGLQIMSGFQRIEDDVDIRTGYIDQVDIQSFDLMGGYAWRYNQGPLKRFSVDLGGAIRQDSYGKPVGENLEVFLWSEFANRIELHGGFEFGRSKYQVSDAADGLFWAPEYIKTSRGNLDFSWERGGFLKEIGIEGGFEKRGIYDEEFTSAVPGFQTTVEGQLVLAPWSNLQWSVEGDWIRQTIDKTGEEVFNGLAYETALHYQVTRSLFLDTRLFGETREDQYSLDFLVGYHFGAGNIVQLSFKKSERNDLFGRQSGYSVTLKVSYLLRV